MGQSDLVHFLLGVSTYMLCFTYYTLQALPRFWHNDCIQSRCYQVVLERKETNNILCFLLRKLFYKRLVADCWATLFLFLNGKEVFNT